MSLVSQIETLRSEVEMLSRVIADSSERHTANEIGVSVNDTAKDEQIIISTIMKEICNRHAKRHDHPVKFRIDEIIQEHLGAFSREYVFQFILKFESEHGYIKLLPQDRVRLTDKGKEYCKSSWKFNPSKI